MKILVTGGAGFIGSNFIRYWRKRHAADQIINIDNLSYAGNNENLKDIKNISNITADICDKNKMERATKGADILFHFAAETHVDRSILNSEIFLKTNVMGTQVLLECALKNKISRFIYISTDEVYGSIQQGTFNEDSPLRPNSPYAASKAAADLLCRSYGITYRLPVIITRGSNNFGPRQYPEKAIPLFITNLIEGKKIPIYGKGLNVREWLYVMDHASALETVCRKGKAGEIYNIGGGRTITNVGLAQKILSLLEKRSESIEFVKDRMGHDFRYSLNSGKIKKLGWEPEYDFDSALEETIQWYIANPFWWKKTKEKNEYKTYLNKNYAGAELN